MCWRSAGLKVTALIDRDVHQHAPFFIALTMSLRTIFGALASGTSTAPITRSADRNASRTLYTLDASVTT